MDIINKLCLVISIIFTFAFILHPPWHKSFRNEKTYNYFLYFSVILPIVALLTLFGKVENQKISVVITFYPIIFLLLYKYFDNRILKKYNRHLIFTVKYNVVWKDDESDYATSTDNWYHLLVCLIPIFLPYGIGWIIFEIIKYCC